MKYKVGDKVRIKNDLKPDEYGVTPPMLGYCGKVMTVKSTYSTLSAYYLVEDDCGFVWHENTLEPADSTTLRMADGTVIGEFAKEGIIGEFKGIPVYATGSTVSIHDLPTSEWYNPMWLTFKNGSSIEALPQKDDTVRGKNHFCTGFEAPYLDLSTFLNNGISAKNGGKNSMKFTFYVTEGTRVDKSCNGTIPTMTTMVSYIDKYGCIMKGTATCDKADYDERQGVLEALANATCGDNFYKAYAEAIKFNRYEDELSRTCAYCGQLLDTREEREEHEAWHVERRKARHERYLLRKRAKEIAFEEQAQKMAKEMMGEQK